MTEKFPDVITNNELLNKLEDGSSKIVDVREPVEYMIEHIPNSILLPFSEIEHRHNELNKNDTIYLICKSGGRSDAVMKFLQRKGFKNVANVIPGMHKWDGPVESGL